MGIESHRIRLENTEVSLHDASFPKAWQVERKSLPGGGQSICVRLNSVVAELDSATNAFMTVQYALMQPQESLQIYLALVGWFIHVFRPTAIVVEDDRENVQANWTPADLGVWSCLEESILDQKRLWYLDAGPIEKIGTQADALELLLHGKRQ